MIGRMAAALSLILIAATLPAPASTRSGVPTAAAATAATAKPPAAEQTHDARAIGAGRFGIAQVYVPEGKPRSVAIFVSGDGGWELGVINMARALRDMGAVVIGVDVNHYFASLRHAAQRADAHCENIAIDLESLSHQVQKQIGLSEYHVPVLLGRHARVCGARAIASRHLCRRTQPRLLRRSGLRGRAVVPRQRAALHAE